MANRGELANWTVRASPCMVEGCGRVFAGLPTGEGVVSRRAIGLPRDIRTVPICLFHVTRRFLMRLHPLTRAMLGCGLAWLLSASLGQAQPAEPKLPDGLRHVPLDAL